jgi:myo-inositol-1(or 4)-monophosphatase
VIVDPIDGSLNAKRNIPYFSVSIAVAEGPTMKDVVFGSSMTSEPARSGPRSAGKAHA